MLTSGTTGLPKCAIVSHYPLITQGIMLQECGKKPYEVNRLLSLPQFHAFTFPLVHMLPLRDEHTTYIMRRFELQEYLGCIHKYQITETAIVPPIALSLVAARGMDTKLLSTLRYVWCAGAPLASTSQARLKILLHPEAVFGQVWGMSETGWITAFPYPESDESGSVGRLLPGLKAK